VESQIYPSTLPLSDPFGASIALKVGSEGFQTLIIEAADDSFCSVRKICLAS